MTKLTFNYRDARTRRACDILAKAVKESGGRALFVGGCVRDAALGKEAEDIDVEVHELQPDILEKVLARHFRLDVVGRAFGVIKLKGVPVDVALPRRESKTGLGHKAFFIESDPHMPFDEAASRRDFTINAMGWDPLTDEILDPFGGMDDLKKRILRHTSDKFAEDPLRVLRGMQFAARFRLIAAPETTALCRGLAPEGLSAERYFGEWRKLILQGVQPSLGLVFLRDAGWLRYFPELAALDGCGQEPRWHPEGDVWTHTLHCLDAFASLRTGMEWEDMVVGFAVLCHDFGKPATTILEDGLVYSPGHDVAGEAPTRSFLERLRASNALIEEVTPLVMNHMRVHELHAVQAGDAAIRRLARKVGRIDRLVRVDQADRLGRPPLLPQDDSPGEWLLERARMLAVADSAPKPIILGRHLIMLGLTPGPSFGEVLAAIYDAQIEGAFANEADGVSLLRDILVTRFLRLWESRDKGAG